MNEIMAPNNAPAPELRKDAGVPAAHDAFHIAAAFVYGSLCSSKKLAMAWRVDVATARKYRLGLIVGALTRLSWEFVLLERVGIRTTPALALLRRAAQRERRRYRERQLQPRRLAA